MGRPEDLVFGNAGDFYVSGANSPNITRYDANGNQQGAPFAALPRVDYLDLICDQDTMYYTTEGGTIGRFGVSTGGQYSPLTVPGPGNLFIQAQSPQKPQ